MKRDENTNRGCGVHNRCRDVPRIDDDELELVLDIVDANLSAFQQYPFIDCHIQVDVVLHIP